ncbi:MAG: glycosyltransferase family 4 protein [Polyangiaceae bacterium]|nr:glycosyltransferase family 4 protein [Polyangiaceae bacterium]
MRVLIVSYSFPPAGGVGVQRVAKLVKYLPDFGVEPMVLTAKNPSVPIEDANLLRDIPERTVVVRTRTLEPSYKAKAKVWRDAAKPNPVRRAIARLASRFFVPDPQILWLPSAAPELRRLSAAADVVLVSAPPFSPFLLGPLARVPFVLDYRDEWRMAASYEMHDGPWATRIIDQLEPALARRAAMIVTATDEFRQNLLQRIPQLDPDRVVTITNGYDPDDFESIAHEPPPPRHAPLQKFVMTYAGTTFRHTSPKAFLAALRILQERDPAILSRLDVRFVGRIVPTEEALFNENPLPCVRRTGVLPREQALRMLAQSHVALLILDAVPGAESMYPAKIFEIMHLRRPLLALAPQGAISRLIENHNLGIVVNPRDPVAIADAIGRYVRAFEQGEIIGPASPIDIERYNRRAIAGQFAEALRSVALRHKSIPSEANF